MDVPTVNEVAERIMARVAYGEWHSDPWRQRVRPGPNRRDAQGRNVSTGSIAGSPCTHLRHRLARPGLHRPAIGPREFRLDRIEKHARARRHQPAAREHRPRVHSGQLPVGQHRHQLAVAHIGIGEVVLHHRDARPGAGEADQQIRRIGGRAAGRDAFPALFAAREDPRHRLAGAREQAQRVVFHQRLGFRRLAAAGDVGGRGIESGRPRGDAPGGERGVVRQLAHADRHVEVLADEVDPPRRQVDLERDCRIAADEVGEEIAENEVREVAGHRYAQAAAGLGLALQCERRRGVDFLRHVARMVEHAAAEVGDAELAGRAQQQALAQLRLQRRHAAGDRGFRQAQALGRAAEAAGVGHAGEQEEVVGFYCCFHGTMISNFMASGYRPATNTFTPRRSTPRSDDEHPADQFQRPPRRLPIHAARRFRSSSACVRSNRTPR